jgi:hypothetical protein
MTIDTNFVDAAKLEIVIFDYLWIGWNAGWCNDSSLLVGASFALYHSGEELGWNWLMLGPHLRTTNPGFNPGFTLHICYIKGGMNPGLNPVLGVLRCGLCEKSLDHPGFSQFLIWIELCKIYSGICILYSIRTSSMLYWCSNLQHVENAIFA